MQTTNIWNLYHLSSKKINLFALLILFTSLASAQSNIQKHDSRNQARKYSYGVHLGLSQHNFRVEHSQVFLNQNQFPVIEGDNNLGLEFGIIGALHPLENLEIRALPSVAFGNRNVVYTDNLADEPEQTFEGETTFFDIPLQLKYKSEPYKDARAFLILGGKYRMNLAYKEAGDNPADDPLRLEKTDLMGEFGFGGEFHFPMFTLAPELKISQGFINQRIQNDRDPLTKNINALYSRMYTLSINIE